MKSARRSASSTARVRALSTLLPLAVFALLSPRALQIISQSDRLLFGLPPRAVYIFVIWLLAILVGLVIARALRKTPDLARKYQDD